MPTRAFGDFRLKYKEFNEHEFSGSRGFRRELSNYHGPYITHKPDIRVHTITSEDSFLIMATDGLWDEMNEKDLEVIFNAHKGPIDKLSDK